MTISITQDELYKRQIALVGESSFLQIKKAKVLLVGVGGLGCPALQYLASAGVGEIGIMDFDVVSTSNLQRQILFDISDIGKKKVDVAFLKLNKLAPFCSLHLFPFALNSLNAQEIISSFDIILDCSDNYKCKFLTHDYAFLCSKILIQASVYQYEGQIQVFDFSKQSGPCLRCLWSEMPKDRCMDTCQEVGVLGPLLGVLGSMQASEAIKHIIKKEHLKNGETLFVDLLTNSFEIRRFKKLENCACRVVE